MDTPILEYLIFRCVDMVGRGFSIMVGDEGSPASQLLYLHALISCVFKVRTKYTLL